MVGMLLDIALVVAAYLLGSLSSAVLVCRALRLPDPRGEGSGNPGATNVLRFGGRKAGALTLAGDFLKGVLPLAAARLLDQDPAVLGLVGLAAFLGHLYPVFFGFQGGKGVATGLGVLLGWHWLALALTVAVWLAMAAAFRISSLSALAAFLLAPAIVHWVTAAPALTAATAAMTLLTYWRHRSNISNLIAGKEDRIGTDKR